eukprot:CAMPEP_0198142298 /NCGR_PEP_ID=MMETSP1443-20131203/5120_1 /TAXON_ID=186043 /ORGANISM="Entomoneis sp., Strain CCMP2396" /LENGTH=533 /DNA_ID=CAMNT_0043805269 /DNA_START=120 /DNA_END=1718 /DNA_ORIENTATION=-
MVDPSRIMPNIYFLGFKSGQALQYLSTVSVSSFDLDQVLHVIYEFPALYGNWWLNLVNNDPIHVLVETTLVVSILYILFNRSKDWKETEEFLSEKEEQELVTEWKYHGRAPLTPASPSSSNESADDLPYKDVVVHKMHGPYIDVCVNGGLVLPTTTTSPARNTLAKTIAKASKKQQTKEQQQLQTTPQVFTVLNFATYDYLGMSSNQPTVRQAADEALNVYGCGSCGPRGFYGTIDVHLKLEQEFAKFLKVDGAILYSDGASTCSSTIAAFAKRGDLIVADEGIYEPLKTGIGLSRAHVKFFKHNDMDDLRKLLTKIQAQDRKVKRPINAQRRFLVVEGLYKHTGTIVPLKELVQLKHEFSYRLILDESNSFGSLGKTGRGVHELYDCKLMHDVEITTIALENSMGAIGGITVGTDEVVEHQRLSGSGYCFSASSPPFTAAAAIQSLQLLKDSSETTLVPLQDNVAYLHHKLTQLCHAQLEDVLIVTSAPLSPIFFLQVADIPETRDLDELLFLREVVQECLLHGNYKNGMAC